MRQILLLVIMFLFGTAGISQKVKLNDTLPAKTLNNVTVNSYLNTIRPVLPEVQGTYLNTGKKTELISLSQTDADLSLKTGRQVFAKVPGVSFVQVRHATDNR